MFHNIDPDELQIDHINGDGTDNRIENLRLATNKQNTRHQIKMNSRNTSGFRGVVWHKQRNKWIAQIMLNGRNTHGGLFTDKSDAINKANKMREDYFGEFRGALGLVCGEQ